MLYLILAESALEIVPESLRGHPAVKRYAARRGRSPDQVFLDRSYHHTAMKRLDNPRKRGRPDIVHVSLLQSLGTPLNKRGMLRVYVHTLDDMVVKVDPKVRLPKNYDRFLCLLEQLYQVDRIPPGGEALMTLTRRSLKRLLEALNPERTLLFTTTGKPSRLNGVCKGISGDSKTVFIVGGFPAGDFSLETKGLADQSYKVFKEPLETWIIISRLIYQYELSVGIDY